MEELVKIIGSACLKHHDSGETSCNKEARVILQTLEENGYSLSKKIPLTDIKSPEEIKSECEKMYAQLKDAEERLKELRSICKHEKTFDGNYSWRPGAIQAAEICSHCGAFIKYK